MSFPCTYCGECCRNIGQIELLNEFNRGDGVCKHLLENNLCGIYGQRPLICRIDEAYNEVLSKYFNKNDYYQKNSDACNLMQENAGINNKYRVQLIRDKNRDRDRDRGYDEY